MRNIPLHFDNNKKNKKQKEVRRRKKKRGVNYEVDMFNLLFINITILYIQHITHEKSIPYAGI